MSSVCIFIIEDDIQDYSKINYLAREIVNIALKNDLGVSFNSTFCNELLEDKGTKNYFLLSDSFLYRQSDELLSVNGLWDKGNIISYKKAFLKRFKFFDIFLNKLFSFGLTNIEILFADVNEPIENIINFEIVQTDNINFLNDLLSITLNKVDNFGGLIPTSLKFIISGSTS